MRKIKLITPLLGLATLTMPCLSLVSCNEPEVKKYTVTWLNDDGTVLEKDENVPEGTVPSFDSDDKLIKDDPFCDYSFEKWEGGDPTQPIASNITFTAKYKQDDIKTSTTIINVSIETDGLDVVFPFEPKVSDVPTMFDWGDGIVTEVGTHTYANKGNYKILVSSVGKIRGPVSNTITSIILGDCVESICDNAFTNCSSLASIKIPNSVKLIGQNAFAGCRSLTSINLPNSVKSIEAMAFVSCQKLETFEAGSGLELIGENAFTSCCQLKILDLSKITTTPVELVGPTFGGQGSDFKIYVAPGMRQIYIDLSPYWMEWQEHIEEKQ